MHRLAAFAFLAALCGCGAAPTSAADCGSTPTILPMLDASTAAPDMASVCALGSGCCDRPCAEDIDCPPSLCSTATGFGTCQGRVCHWP